MFRESAEKEQELYQSVARAGTLLLQIGDAANKQDETKSSSNCSFVKSCEIDEDRPKQVILQEEQAQNDQQSVPSLGKPMQERTVGIEEPSNLSEELELNVRIQGMSLTEALADAQRSLSSSPGRTESIKSEDYVYVDESQDSGPMISPETSQNNLAKAEYESIIGSSYKEIASCIGESSDILYKELETEAIHSSPLKDPSSSRRKMSDGTVGSSSEVSGPSNGSVEQGTVSDKWEIGFRQFMACVLSEPSLVDFFEQRYDLKDALDKAKHDGLQTCSKSTDDSLID